MVLYWYVLVAQLQMRRCFSSTAHFTNDEEDATCSNFRLLDYNYPGNVAESWRSDAAVLVT